VPPSRYAKIQEATERYHGFTGHEPQFIDTYNLPDYDVAFKIGHCDGILYTTVRDGKTERYIHRFKKNSRPFLCASHDGKQLIILEGGFRFTNRGIVDT
jgi:hypothetical protein